VDLPRGIDPCRLQCRRIRDIPSVKEVIEQMIRRAQEIINGRLVKLAKK